jgi:hypothetical protein
VAAVTQLGTTTFNTNSGTHTVVATPALGDLIILIVANTGYTGTTVPTDNNSDGLGTYTLIGTPAVKVASADRMQMYVRNAKIGSGSSTTFTHAAGTTSGGGLIVLKVTDMSLVGSAAIVQSAKQDNQGVATPAPVFGAAPKTGNPVIGAVFNGTSPATMTPRTGFTERGDAGYATPTTGLEGMSRNSGETSTTQTWGSSSSAFASMVVELDATVTISVSDSVVVRDGIGETTTYYFDASDGGPTDPDSRWTNDANAFDGSTGTQAALATGFGSSVSSNYLMGEGTDAPGSGATIDRVVARVMSGGTSATPIPINAAIYTNGLAELLGTATDVMDVSSTWGSYATLSTPSGGWTWAKVQALEVKIYGPPLDPDPFAATVKRVEIDVATLEPPTLFVTELMKIVTDGITVTDSLRGYQDTIYTSEIINVSITGGGGAPDLSVNVSDTATTTESRVVLIPDLVVNKSDSITVSESVQRLTEIRISATDTATVTESVLRHTDNRVSVSDTATITENVQRDPTNRISVSDTATVTENRALDVPVNVSRSDTVTVTESSTVTIEVVGSYSVSVSDSLTTTEAVQRMAENRIAVSDTATITESVQRQVENRVAVTDTATVTEAVQRLVEGRIAVSDSVTLSESIQRHTDNRLAVSDSLTVTESTSLVIPVLFISVSDGVTVTESVAANIPIVGLYTVSVNDSVTLTENIAAVMSATLLSVNDTATVTENRSVSIQATTTPQVSVSDSVTATESVNRMAESRIAVSDSAGVTESTAVSLTAAGNLSVAVSDSATVTDTPGLLIPALYVTTSDSTTITESVALAVAGGVVTPDVAVSDSITTTEAVQVQTSAVLINVSDSLTVSESVQLEGVSFINKSDTFTITESVQRMRESYISKSETITITESVNVFRTSHNITVSDSITITESVALFIPVLFLRVIELVTITEAIDIDSNNSGAIWVPDQIDPGTIGGGQGASSVVWNPDELDGGTFSGGQGSETSTWSPGN